MKRQKTQMLILSILLVLCAAGYFLAADTAAQKEAADEQKENGAYTALSFDQTLLTGLEIAGEEGSLKLTLDNGVWEFVNDIAEETGAEEGTVYEVNTSKANEILEALADLTCTKEIKEVTDLTQYGLDTPQVTVTASLSDETVHTVEIGDENAMIGCRYIRVDGSDTVYTMKEDTFELFSQADTDLAQEADG